jgi:O-antigen/teichoic acid export membrane protein
MSFRQKFFSGIFWAFGDQFGSQVINFVVSIILARLLFPEEYGLMGMVAVIMAVGHALVNGGFTISLIRMQSVTERDYSTVFVLNVLISVVLYGIVFLSTPWISVFFKQEQLTSLIRVFSLSLIINAFSEVQMARLAKQLMFKKQLQIKIPSLILSSVIGIVLAYHGFGVWSLVWMQLAQGFFQALQLWITSDWRPSITIDKKILAFHFGFGYKILLSVLIDTVYNNIYNLIIGRFYPLAQLGYYNRADSLKQLPVNNISGALNAVTYPLLAGIQDDPVRLKEVYRKILQQVLFWVSSVVIFMAVMALPLIRLVFTDKWLPSVPYFQILCIAGILFPLHAYNLNILNIKGRSDLFLRLEVIKKVILTLGILVAIPFGIYGLLYMQVVFSIIAYFINSYYSGRFIGYNVWEQLRDLFPIFLLVTFAGLALWLIRAKLLVFVERDVFKLLIGGCVFFLTIFSIAIWAKMTAAIEILKLLRRND